MALLKKFLSNGEKEPFLLVVGCDSLSLDDSMSWSGSCRCISETETVWRLDKVYCCRREGSNAGFTLTETEIRVNDSVSSHHLKIEEFMNGEPVIGDQVYDLCEAGVLCAIRNDWFLKRLFKS